MRFSYYGWSPGIGDPTYMAWLTVFAYFLTAVLCFAAYRRYQQPSSTATGNSCRSVSSWIWFGLFLAFIFLGINKQLDLQTLFTAAGRALARQQGWYVDRRKYQAVFIAVLILLVSAMMLFTFVLMFRLVGTAERLALIGAVFVVTFVLVRASSFHHMDILICSRQFGVKMNWVLEWSGIAIVFFAALFCQTQDNKR
jgi:flagellar biosynthesis protein FlhB